MAEHLQSKSGTVDRAALAEVREELNLAVSLMNAASQRVEQVGVLLGCQAGVRACPACRGCRVCLQT